jgi:ADP-ribosylglycohydrolase
MRPSFDGIIGFAIGDALGVPVEFVERKQLANSPVVDMEGGGTYSMPAGCWSDDTSLTLATMDAIYHTSGEINKNTYFYIANNFAKYYYSNFFTPTDKAFDIGNTTRKAITNFAQKHVHPLQAGGNGPFNEGNGALMRILPIAYYASEKNLSPEETQKIVNNVSSITHRLPTCRLGSYIYTEFARKLLEGSSKEDAYKYIQSLDYSNYPTDVVFTYSRILRGDITDLEEKDISSDGRTLPTLEASMWCFMKDNDYRSTVIDAVNLGEDTDTIAAIAGGLAGIHYGLNDIPNTWLEKCKRVDYINDICSNFDKAISKKQNKNINDDFER